MVILCLLGNFLHMISQQPMEHSSVSINHGLVEIIDMFDGYDSGKDSYLGQSIIVVDTQDHYRSLEKPKP